MSICRVCHEPFSLLEKHNFFWFACVGCVKKARTKSRFHKRRKGATGCFSPTDWLITLLEYEFKCAECNKFIPHLTLDHKVSISGGGTNTYDNMQPLCSSCHSRKAHEENVMHNLTNRATRRKRKRHEYVKSRHSHEVFPCGGSGAFECEEVSSCL